MTIRSYKDLTVWQKSLELSLLIYQQSEKPRVLPEDECFQVSPAWRDEHTANSFAVKLAEKIPRALPVELHKITKKFPKEETYGLISQIRRSAVSIPSNVAEGYSRHRRLEYIQFLQIAFASGAELETQLLIAKSLGYVLIEEFTRVNNLLQEVMKMLNSLIRKLKETGNQANR